MIRIGVCPAHSRNVVAAAKRKKPDYASRRSGNQEENLRRRANGHQMPLSARAPLERDSRDTSSNLRARSSKGTLYMNPTRRRGRPAHQRSPDDSPLRDGNRDRLIGLLTLRAAKTLEYYFMETNLTYHHWLSEYIRRNPIPLEGSWDAVSGEEFLRKLLTEGVDATSYKGGVRDPLFSCVGTIGVDPRAIGQRVMDIRSALAKEFIQDLQNVAEENAVLMRECAMMSLSALDSLESDEEFSPHPEMQDGAMAIPDTASEFLTRASETDIERFQREREAREATDSDSAVDDLGSASSSDDAIRPGVDDINEFESELEAPEKWARRFRMMKEAESAGSTDESSSPDIKAEGQSDADVKGHSTSSDEGESSTDTTDNAEKPGDKDKPCPE